MYLKSNEADNHHPYLLEIPYSNLCEDSLLKHITVQIQQKLSSYPSTA